MSRKMKDSGIEWIGEIPEEWEVAQIKRYVKLYTGNSISDNEKENFEDQDDAIPYISTKDINLTNCLVNYENGMYVKERDYSFKRANSDSILLCIEGGSAGKKIAFIKRMVAFVNKLCCFESIDINSKYLFYFVQSPIFGYQFSVSQFGLMGGVSVKNISNFKALIPTKYEQVQIANYLDLRCALIDQTIKKQKQVIEKLKEHKQSVITEAVTKGLNLNVPMKDSGSDYWGELPENWSIKKLKYIFSIVKRIAGQEGYDVLSITQNGIKVKDLSNNEGQIAQDYSNYQLVEVGDFAMNHMDLLTGWVDVSKYNGVTSPDYRVFKLDDEKVCDRRYYLHLMQTCYRNKIFYGLGQGVSSLGRWRLQADKFLNFLIPVPKIEEQKAIAAYIDDKCIAIDNAISVKEKVLDKLELYKKSLIYECVTGKREVK